MTSHTETRVCTRCHTAKSVAEFPVSPGRSSNPSWCKACRTEYNREYMRDYRSGVRRSQERGSRSDIMARLETLETQVSALMQALISAKVA
jgi:hypothetical protein